MINLFDVFLFLLPIFLLFLQQDKNVVTPDLACYLLTRVMQEQRDWFSSHAHFCSKSRQYGLCFVPILF
jgi:hypothetical protein